MAYPPPPGQPVYPYLPPRPAGGTNGLAIASLILGVVSWFALPIIGAIAAVVTGHMARGQLRTSGEEGRGFATAGMVLGYVHLAVAAVILVLFGALVITAITEVSDTVNNLPVSPSPFPGESPFPEPLPS